MCALLLSLLDVPFQDGPTGTEAQPSLKPCSDAATCHHNRYICRIKLNFRDYFVLSNRLLNQIKLIPFILTRGSDSGGNMSYLSLRRFLGER